MVWVGYRTFQWPLRRSALRGSWLGLIGVLAVLVWFDVARAEPVVGDLRITVNNEARSTAGAFFVDIRSKYTVHVVWPDHPPRRDGHLKVTIRPAYGGQGVTLWDKPLDLTRPPADGEWTGRRIPMNPAGADTSAFFGSGRDWVFRADVSATGVEPMSAETTVRLMQGPADAGEAVVRIWGEAFDYPGHPAEGQPLPAGGAVPATARSLGYAWVPTVESLPPGSSAHYRVTDATGRVIEESAAGLPSDLRPGRPLILGERPIRNHPSGHGEMPAGMLSLTIEIRAGDGTVIDTDTARFRLTDPDARDPFGNAVEVAACEGDAARVRSCLLAGCTLGPNQGSAAVMCAAENGYLDVMRALIEGGANVNAFERHGRYSALFAAASEGHNEVVRMLLNSGAQPNRPQYRGGTALHAAVWGGNLALAERLLAAGADPSIRDEKGRTAGYYAYWLHKDTDLAARMGYRRPQDQSAGRPTSAPNPPVSTRSENESEPSAHETDEGDWFSSVDRDDSFSGEDKDDWTTASDWSSPNAAGGRTTSDMRPNQTVSDDQRREPVQVGPLVGYTLQFQDHGQRGVTRSCVGFLAHQVPHLEKDYSSLPGHLKSKSCGATYYVGDIEWERCSQYMNEADYVMVWRGGGCLCNCEE